MIPRIFCLLTISSSLCLLSACGSSDKPELLAVTGTVTYKTQPLKNASVVFMPEGGMVAIGRTDEAGHFELNTQGEPGAAEGTYKVVITAVEDLPQKEAGQTADGGPVERPGLSKSLIPEKYGSPKTSGLDATVSADKKEFTFALTQ
jgi:hypothetical protein